MKTEAKEVYDVNLSKNWDEKTRHFTQINNNNSD